MFLLLSGTPALQAQNLLYEDLVKHRDSIWWLQRSFVAAGNIGKQMHDNTITKRKTFQHFCSWRASNYN